MSVGLGMTSEEWEQLKSQVDDSFWVMRIIGTVMMYKICMSVLMVSLDRLSVPAQRLRGILMRGSQVSRCHILSLSLLFLLFGPF
jgi:hypothetical protein